MKKILVLQGHPDPKSYCQALALNYVKGATEAGASVEFVNIGELEFSPNLKFGYRKRTELEPDLMRAWEQLLQAEHLVLVHPVWWGGMPAITKGFFDRLLLPGKAFKKREGSLFWDRFLTGKTARIITTMDQPTWFYRIFNKAPSYHAVKKLTFQFVGFGSVKITGIGPIRLSTDEFRIKNLEKVYKLGKMLK